MRAKFRPVVDGQAAHDISARLLFHRLDVVGRHIAPRQSQFSSFLIELNDIVLAFVLNPIATQVIRPAWDPMTGAAKDNTPRKTSKQNSFFFALSTPKWREFEETLRLKRGTGATSKLRTEPGAVKYLCGHSVITFVIFALPAHRMCL